LGNVIAPLAMMIPLMGSPSSFNTSRLTMRIGDASVVDLGVGVDVHLALLLVVRDLVVPAIRKTRAHKRLVVAKNESEPDAVHLITSEGDVDVGFLEVLLDVTEDHVTNNPRDIRIGGDPGW
jgi:hypothetical protein